MQSGFRSLEIEEKRLLSWLLEKDFSGRDQLSRQVDDCLVRVIDDNGSLEFHVNPELSRADLENRVPVEAEGVDADGVGVHVLLHVPDGRVAELEIYRDDGGRLIQEISPDALEVISLPSPPEVGGG